MNHASQEPVPLVDSKAGWRGQSAQLRLQRLDDLGSILPSQHAKPPHLLAHPVREHVRRWTVTRARLEIWIEVLEPRGSAQRIASQLFSVEPTTHREPQPRFRNEQPRLFDGAHLDLGV